MRTAIRVAAAVNAGSDTISVFAVHGDRLALRQVLGSGGTFPVSVAVHGDLVYVLNALNGGSVQGYRVLGRFLVRIPGSHRALGLDPNATPQFTTTPGQVAFTPDGSQLVVTTKGNGNDIDVFGVGFGGLLSAKPTVNEQPGTVPFAISFDPFGHLVIAEAGTNAVSTFQLSRGGTASLLHRTPTGQEVVQDTWLAALRGLEAFEGRSSLKTWLFRILVNRARTTGSKEQRSVPVADPEPAVDPTRFGGDGGWSDPPEHWIEAAERRMEAGKLADRIRAWLGELPARQREVVLLRDIEGMSSEEVCTVLALTEGNQRVLLHRGRSRLRQLFEDEFRELR